MALLKLSEITDSTWHSRLIINKREMSNQLYKEPNPIILEINELIVKNDPAKTWKIVKTLVPNQKHH